VFAGNLVGSTITLTTGQIEITQPVLVAGFGAQYLTVSGNHSSRIFYVHTGTASSAHPVKIIGLTLADGTTNARGGAIYAYSSNLYVTNSTIRNCHATLDGGAVAMEAPFGKTGSLAIEYSRLTGNTAASGSGGAVWSNGSNAFLYADTISNNAAYLYGGGVYGANAPVFKIYDSTISGNVVPEPGGPYNTGGGGIFLKNVGTAGAFSHIGNSTIHQNYSGVPGGGVLLYDATSAANVAFEFDTITDNLTALPDDTGVGITALAGTAHLDSCIVANNSARSITLNDLAGSFSVNYSLIKSKGFAVVTGSHNVLGIDPKLSVLGDHGGRTLTQLPAADSPVINGASNPEFPVYPLDQRRLPRPVGAKDMGAVERQFPEDLIFRAGFDPL
jgi:hypothetical protein